MNCQNLTDNLNQIRRKHNDLLNVIESDIPRAIELKNDLQVLVKEIKDEVTFTIEGREFPISLLQIGGKSKYELIKLIENQDVNISLDVKNMVNGDHFTTLSSPETIKTIKLKVKDLNIKLDSNERPTIYQIYNKARELGLEICPAEVALWQRLKEKNQPLKYWYNIATEPLLLGNNEPNIFSLMHNHDGLWLGNSRCSSVTKWDLNVEFMFCLSESSKS